MTFTPTVLGNGLAGYNFLTRTRDTQQALFASSAQVSRNTDAFAERLQDIQTSDELMADRTMLQVALGAFGLDDDLNNTAFLQQILDSDLTDSTSLANRLADKRYLAFAQAFNFAGEGGPQLSDIRTEESLKTQLAGLQTADDLLNDASLLRASLKTLGLEADSGNTYFLKQVLESDITDAGSFVNTLTDTRYVELAEAFDFAEKNRDDGTIFGFAKLFEDKAADIQTFDDLLAEPELLDEALRVFGLQDDGARTAFLRDVMESDLGDDASVANSQGDTRYIALTDLFGFADRQTAVDFAAANNTEVDFTSKLEEVVEDLNATTNRPDTPDEVFQDITLMLDAFRLFDLPTRTDSADFARRILNSDSDNPTSLVNVFPDQRYQAFATAFNFTDPVEGRVYPPGFADQIVENYLDRQFEIQIGEQDSTMRIALSMERDLQQVVDTTSANDSRWFSVMASNLLREVFETAFQLPSSFGTLDIDRQLTDLKERSIQFFGTDQVADYLETDQMTDLRERYLFRSTLTFTDTTTSANVASTLLSQIQGG